MVIKLREARREQMFKKLQVRGDYACFRHRNKEHCLKLSSGAKDEYRTRDYFTYKGKRYYV